MIPYSRADADQRQHGAERVERRRRVVLAVRREQDDGDDHDQRHDDVDDEHRSPPERGKIHQPVSRKPATSGPSAPPAPANPAQIAIALARLCGGKTAVSNDNVAGITNAAPMPEIARDAITASDESAKAPSSEPAANMASRHDQCLFATEAVADRARRQQQTGEDDRVRVDDPLQIGRRGAE